jgi:5-methylcytosine-specific restriction endonuclease McrA
MERTLTMWQQRRLADPKTGWDRYAARDPERSHFYQSAVWRGARARHLRDHPNCVVCSQPANFVDHIVPRSEGGADLDPSNLQSMCRRCHGQKTQAESKRGNKRAAERRRIERSRRKEPR